MSRQSLGTISISVQTAGGTERQGRRLRGILWLGISLFLLHAFFMLYRYGSFPVAPVLDDEVITSEPAVALSRGQGLVAPAFRDSSFGLDKLYAHFPPVYIFAESLPFRAFGVSV